MNRVPVWVHADDPISRHGVVTQIRSRPELRILEPGEERDAVVALVVVDSLDEAAARELRRLRRAGAAKLVLVPARIDDVGLSMAVECGVVGMVRRGDATADRLVHVITSAVRGEGAMPADLLGRLLQQMGQLQRQVLEPRGLTLVGMTAREIDVLRLLADGLDTREVADKLSYSERTVKNVLHDVTRRLQLRNRTHAVAYALRQGLI